MSNPMLNAAVAFFRSTWTCRRGSVAVIFALSLAVLIGATGLAVDFARVSSLRAQVQDAVDSAALAGVRAAQISPQSRAQSARAAAEAYLTSATFPGLVLTRMTITTGTNASEVKVAVDGYIQTPLLGLLSRSNALDTAPPECRGSSTSCQTLTAQATATATDLGKPVEISLMVDLTWSMWGVVKGRRKLDVMKDTLRQFIDVALSASDGSGNVRIAVVPFSRNVNAGIYASRVMGLPETKPDWFWGTIRLYHCVTERTGPNAYTDAEPNATNGFIGSYGGVTFWGADYGNIGPRCEWPDIPVLPLTDNRMALLNLVDSINLWETDPLTAGHMATAWSWYVLSPNWNSVWNNPKNSAANYGDATKIAVLMTDGDYNIKFRNEPKSFDQAAALCDNMKKAGVTVFTIGFDIKGPWVWDKKGAERVLSNCASSKDYFFAPEDEDEIRAAYQQIAIATIGKPRLVK